LLVEDGGHLDILDDQTPGCVLVCSACTESSAPASLRATAAGLIVATVFAAQGSSTSIDDAITEAPVAITTP
jgi:hypothetical protein